MHKHCMDDLVSMKMDGSCPLCRAKTPTSAMESFKQVRPWVKKKKAWAQFSMGGMYERGLGVKQSYEMARRLYEQAAQQGFASAMYNLGFMYYDGEGVEQLYEKAIEYYEPAAHLGHSDAQYNLGRMYATGEGVAKDFAKAKALWTTSAAQGDESSLTALEWLKEQHEQ